MPWDSSFPRWDRPARPTAAGRRLVEWRGRRLAVVSRSRASLTFDSAHKERSRLLKPNRVLFPVNGKFNNGCGGAARVVSCRRWSPVSLRCVGWSNPQKTACTIVCAWDIIRKVHPRINCGGQGIRSIAAPRCQGGHFLADGAVVGHRRAEKWARPPILQLPCSLRVLIDAASVSDSISLVGTRT